MEMNCIADQFLHQQITHSFLTEEHQFYTVLVEMYREFMSALHKEELTKRLCNEAAVLLEADRVEIVVLGTWHLSRSAEMKLGPGFAYTDSALNCLIIGCLESQVYRLREIVTTSDHWNDLTLEHWPEQDEQLKQNNIVARMVVPVVFHNKLVAFLEVQKCQPYRWNMVDRYKAGQFAGLVAVALYNAWLEQNLSTLNHELDNSIHNAQQIKSQLEIQLKQQEVLNEISQLMKDALVLPELLEWVTRTVIQTLEMGYGVILETLPNDELKIAASSGWENLQLEKVFLNTSFKLQASCTCLIGEPVVVENLSQERRFPGLENLQQYGIASGIIIAIQEQKHRYGVIALYSAHLRTFTETEIKFLQTVANLLAVAFSPK